MSLSENIGFNLLFVLPYFLQGIFTKTPFWVDVFTRFHPDYSAVRFVQRLRAKYKSSYLYVYMLRNRTVLVLDRAGIEQVLQQSPAVYGPPELKVRGMTHFQPGAVTISDGKDWQERRVFNEAVLESKQRVHSEASKFLTIVRDEVSNLTNGSLSRLRWGQFDYLFKRITLQVIFGTQAKSDFGLTDRLDLMMRESNRVFLLGKSCAFDAFYAQIRAFLAAPDGDSLASKCPHAASTANTRVENQIPHWMFAMMETLATNTLRAFALILSHPAAEARVRNELRDQDLLLPQAVDGFDYLEGCLQEAMRLWPTTSFLARQTDGETQLAGCTVPAKTQVLIMNNFNHRDWETVPFADQFYPDFWLNTRSDYRFNHLSNGAQYCAGKSLALLLGKAVLGNLLSARRYRLIAPRLDPTRRLPYGFNEFRVEFADITGAIS